MSCVPVFASCGKTRSGSPYSTMPSSKMPSRRDVDAEAVDARDRRRARRRLRRAPRGVYARAGSLPSDASVRRRPSSSDTSGSQPRSCLARVMSGCRTCGSSTGRASYTIWLDEPVAASTASAELEEAHLGGIADVHGMCSPDSARRIRPRTRSSTKQKLPVCDPSPKTVSGFSSSAWRMKVGMARPSCGRIRGP